MLFVLPKIICPFSSNFLYYSPVFLALYLSFSLLLLLTPRGGYVFGGVGLSVCLSVCLSVSRITQKVVNGFQ